MWTLVKHAFYKQILRKREIYFSNCRGERRGERREERGDETEV